VVWTLKHTVKRRSPQRVHSTVASRYLLCFIYAVSSLSNCIDNETHARAQCHWNLSLTRRCIFRELIMRLRDEVSPSGKPNKLNPGHENRGLIIRSILRSILHLTRLQAAQYASASFNPPSCIAIAEAI